MATYSVSAAESIIVSDKEYIGGGCVSFHEIQFPSDISADVQGGPMFSTVVITTGSGAETRIGQWSRPRSRWDFSYKDRPMTQVQAIDKFFRARFGRLYAFRWKDWADYTASNELLVNPYPGTGMQLQKTYSDIGGASIRIIYKPVLGTVTLRKNGANFASGGNWSISPTTGLITLLVVPSPTDIFDWSGQFDVPVRFEEDQLKYTQQSPTMYSIDNCAVVEILVLC